MLTDRPFGSLVRGDRDPEMNATVRLTQSDFQLTNNDSFDWINVTVDIAESSTDGTLDRDRHYYKFAFPGLARGETVCIDFKLFMDSARNHFGGYPLRIRYIEICSEHTRSWIRDGLPAGRYGVIT